MTVPDGLCAETIRAARRAALEEAAVLVLAEAAHMMKRAPARWTLYRIADRIRALSELAAQKGG